MRDKGRNLFTNADRKPKWFPCFVFFFFFFPSPPFSTKDIRRLSRIFFLSLHHWLYKSVRVYPMACALPTTHTHKIQSGAHFENDKEHQNQKLNVLRNSWNLWRYFSAATTNSHLVFYFIFWSASFSAYHRLSRLDNISFLWASGSFL